MPPTDAKLLRRDRIHETAPKYLRRVAEEVKRRAESLHPGDRVWGLYEQVAEAAADDEEVKQHLAALHALCLDAVHTAMCGQPPRRPSIRDNALVGAARLAGMT